MMICCWGIEAGRPSLARRKCLFEKRWRCRLGFRRSRLGSVARRRGLVVRLCGVSLAQFSFHKLETRKILPVEHPA